MVFLVVSAVLMFTAATVYVLTVGLHEKLVFPNMKNTVPDVWLHRALVYSNQSGTGFEQAVVGHVSVVYIILWPTGDSLEIISTWNKER